WFFWAFVGTSIGLGYLGSQQPQGWDLIAGRLLPFYFFALFLVALLVVRFFCAGSLEWVCRKSAGWVFPAGFREASLRLCSATTPRKQRPHRPPHRRRCHVRLRESGSAPMRCCDDYLLEETGLDDCRRCDAAGAVPVGRRVRQGRSDFHRP